MNTISYELAKRKHEIKTTVNIPTGYRLVENDVVHPEDFMFNDWIKEFEAVHKADVGLWADNFWLLIRPIKMNICRNCKKHESTHCFPNKSGEPELCGQCSAKLYGILLNNPISTVGQLIDTLSQFPRNLRAFILFDAIREINVYQSSNGKERTVILTGGIGGVKQ